MKQNETIQKKPYHRPLVASVQNSSKSVLLACTPPKTDCDAVLGTTGCGCQPENFDCDQNC